MQAPHQPADMEESNVAIMAEKNPLILMNSINDYNWVVLICLAFVLVVLVYINVCDEDSGMACLRFPKGTMHEKAKSRKAHDWS